MELLLVPVAVGMGTPPGSENTKHASTFKHLKVFLSSAVGTMFNAGLGANTTDTSQSKEIE